MPVLRESKGLLYTLIVVGVLALVASLYLTGWAGSPQSASAQDTGTTSTDGQATEEATEEAAEEATEEATEEPAIAVPEGGAIVELAPGTAATLSSPDGKVTVSIPASGPRAAGSLLYAPTTASNAPAPAPGNGSFGDTLFELTGYDEANESMASVRLDSAATITISYSDADLAAADGNPTRLTIYKYDNAFPDMVATHHLRQRGRRDHFDRRQPAELFRSRGLPSASNAYAYANGDASARTLHGNAHSHRDAASDGNSPADVHADSSAPRGR